MRSLIEALLSFAPWVISMYLLYWLEISATWTAETAHRDKYSVLVLVIGMGLSFLVYSLLNKRKQKP